MARLTFEYCDIQNSINPAIWILETVNSVNDITVDHCYFKNNYYAVQIPKGATGWRVTNNIGYNQSSYVNARMPLQLEGTVTDIANNFFDFNNWYYDGASPVRVGGTTLSFTQWQAKGADQHSVSLNPNLATATPLKLPTVTLTPIPATVAPAITASSIPASRTPTASSIPVLPSATPQPTLPSLATSTTVPGGSTSLDIRVTSGGDDVGESSTGSMSINSSDLELTYDNNTQLVGIRFKGVNIPKNATILNAYIQFKVNEVNSEGNLAHYSGRSQSQCCGV